MDTKRVILDLLFALVLEWCGYKFIMITKTVSNIDLLIFCFIFSFLCDLYFLIFLPFFWIFKSWKGNWAGWTNGSRRRRMNFFITRSKPELIRPEPSQARGNLELWNSERKGTEALKFNSTTLSWLFKNMLCFCFVINKYFTYSPL